MLNHFEAEDDLVLHSSLETSTAERGTCNKYLKNVVKNLYLYYILYIFINGGNIKNIDVLNVSAKGVEIKMYLFYFLSG